MITLYTWTTPNGRKVSILLEELGVSYEVHPINLSQRQQFTPEFSAISPNNRIPAIVDSDADNLSVFESGAILTYLAEKHGQFLDVTGPGRYKALEWLNWQMGGFGPMLGQLAFFEKFSGEKSALASSRFIGEADRLLTVLEQRFSDAPYLAGEKYSIADIATYPWAITATTFLQDVLAAQLVGKPNLFAWMDRVGNRPAVQRGMSVPRL
ncbi:glutathione S-transferase family protein [Pseudomonas sp. 6D_7.1_Bac1]|uniref:glutathione S-transferase family protein n=1 Tax=Pseudomonas sp. 6D_7.1_Bac1 TaxID=2971615 RepID=UPI0021CA0A5D|nr:glutathione S-transferase N-terminal domain-containing protein [Pseudomonas sp. 6D_7.1_Bac1]MCU1753226.1 glutathione S-transferase N-terminal domain-containing protein [Pseudomonas sp. 6D_7.1_Bac1]